MNPATWRISDAHALPACKQQLAALLRARGAGEEAVSDALLAAEEILVNILQHARLSAGQAAELHCKTKGCACLTFIDTGVAFNPLTDIPAANLNADDATRAGGGFGFHLARSLAARIEYHRRDGQNVLTITMPAFTTVSP